jgi:hypothetical protein
MSRSLKARPTQFSFSIFKISKKKEDFSFFYIINIICAFFCFFKLNYIHSFIYSFIAKNV